MRLKHGIGILLVTVTLLCGEVRLAAAKTFHTLASDGHNLVEFVSDATLEKVVGRTSDIHGSVNLHLDSLLGTTKADFRVDLRTIDTGIALRNQHMRENHLETAKYPEAVFTLTRFISADQDSLTPGQTAHVLAEGDLALHGVTRSYQIPLTLTYDHSNVTVAGEWTVKLADHEINRPAFLFLRLAEEIKITVNVTLGDNVVKAEE
jgi:polyisoprenoid-binding protein YceI